jgi:hypothetical protein
MDSLVKPRPNHYELLGLTPAATDDEIARAFAREISPLTPHAFGDIALLSVAHETLRDLAKRRAYDDSLGLNAKPKAPKPLQGWQYKTTVRVAGATPPPARSAPPTAPAQPVRSEPEPAPDPQPAREWIPPRPVPLQHFRPIDDPPSDWKRPAVIGGGIFLGVGLLGVLAGVWAARDVQSKIPSDALQIEAPAEAKPAPAEPPAQPTGSRAEPSRTSSSSASRARARGPNAVEAQEQRAEEVPDIPTEQVAALASQAGVADDGAAPMPLSNGVIARTIGRIGYSCGEVVSTSAVDGSPGAFKVTCSSGQSFRAAPVGGRYRFRRWGG